MPILNSIPVVGTTLVDFNQQPGISFEIQGGPEDNQGTEPTPFTSQLTFQYGSPSRERSPRDGAAYQGGYGSVGVLGGGSSAGGNGSKMSDPMIP